MGLSGARMQQFSLRYTSYVDLEKRRIQAIEEKPLPAEIEQFVLPIGEREYQAFRVTLPEGYTYPPQQPHEEWALKHRRTVELPEPGLIARDVAKDPSALMNDARESGITSFMLSKYGTNDWYLHSADRPVNVPSSIREIISIALAHEMSINPNIRSFGTVNVRLEKTAEFRDHPVTHPHVDNVGKASSLYFYALPPTTQVYTGKLKSSARDGGRSDDISSKAGGTWWKRERVQKYIRWSSLLPNTLYRLTGDSAHSMPDLSDVAQEDLPEERLLIRIGF